MKAKLIYRHKKEDEKGNITEIVIWSLPCETPDRPHGIKYRCYYGNASGYCLVRYDNETGKGDHKHLHNKEESYQFESAEKLMLDFITDIQKLIREEK